MKKEIIFRDFRQDDYPCISELWALTGLGNNLRGDDLKTIELSLNMGGKFIVMVHEPGHRIIGTSWMTFDGRRLHLHHFGIDPEFQGQKLSVPLLKESLRFAKEKNVQIKLEVHQDNQKAVQLYTKNHFRYLGDYRVYIIRNPGDLDGI